MLARGNDPTQKACVERPMTWAAQSERLALVKALKPGDPAPKFDLPTAGGGRVSLASLKGQRVVLYFYPKDDTEACTQEALNFTEKASDFAAANTVVLGVSRDTVAKHDKFAAKYGLTLLLGSDVEGVACEAYGVWVEKSMYGRQYMGVERSTFLIDQKGRISHVWRKVRVRGHVDDVLSKINETS
jgi:peroxiredoxin Q/BCP